MFLRFLNASKELLVVAAAFTAAAMLLTLPLVLDLRHQLPSDLTDTVLAAWLISWDADHLRHFFRGVWDAPIFFPYRGTLAFSENLLGLAIFVAPVRWLTGDAILTYNVAFLLSFVVAGAGMYLLARELTGSRAAAWAAGTCYAFGPFRMAQIAHVQMVATGWMPIALWGLHRYFSMRQWRWLAVFAVAWALQATSQGYIGYFIALPIAAVIADGLWRSGPDWRRVVLHIGAAGLLLGAMLAPVAAAYFHVRADYHLARTAGEIAGLSADARSYAVGKTTVGVWRWLPTAVPSDPERELFPGIFAVALAAIGLWAGHRDPRLKRWSRLYGVIVVCAVILSMGPIVRVWGVVVTTHGPYGWLLRAVPGMNGMRVPARFAIVVMLGLAVLVACGVAWLTTRLTGPARGWTLGACLIAIVADGVAVPLPIVRYSMRGRPEDRAVASWLDGRAPGALLHLPAIPPEYETLHYQFMTLVHGHPIVNGYSGYATPLLQYLASAASPLDDVERFPAAVRMLRSLGVRYVIVHPADYEGAAKAAGVPERTIDLLRRSGEIVKEAGLPGVTAFELQPWRPPPGAGAAVTAVDARELTVTASEANGRLENLFDGDPDSRWIAGLGGQDGSSWLRLSLAQPTDVARVEMRLATRSMTDFPRALRIDSVDPAGTTRVLYEATPYAELASAIVRDDRYPNITVSLPHNNTAVLWIRQTAPSRASWSIHELRLSRYDSSGGIR